MDLYRWSPIGHGPDSFFVAANSLTEAVAAVREAVDEMRASGEGYEAKNWPHRYELTVVPVGVVLRNPNQ